MATSMQDPKDTSGRLIAADEVQGTDIYNQAGESLGKVEDIMLDKITGKACYAIASFGGFMGISSKEYPLPWEKLTYDTKMQGFVVDIDKATLENAPAYSVSENWQDSDWRAVDTHYKAKAPF